jgi:hypothetical protein
MHTTHQTVDNNVRLAGKKSNLPAVLLLLALLAIAAYFLIPKLQQMDLDGNGQALVPTTQTV